MKPTLNRVPRRQPLPGMEDAAITELESLAADYAEMRDRRQTLKAEEALLKARVLAAMRKHRKDHYHRAGITIRIRHGADDVTVHVAQFTDPQPDPSEGAS
jgi:hypothetical protein